MYRDRPTRYGCRELGFAVVLDACGEQLDVVAGTDEPTVAGQPGEVQSHSASPP
jgi:hypothetical protein